MPKASCCLSYFSLRLRARVKAVWFWVSAARFPRRIVGRKENKKPRLPHPAGGFSPSASNDEKHWGVSFIVFLLEFRGSLHGDEF